MKLESLAGKNVLVVGALGKTGQAMTALLTKVGCIVYGLDQNLTVSNSIQDLKIFDSTNVSESLRTTQIAAVFVSPGVPLSQTVFQEARNLNLPILGDLDLGYLYLQELNHSKPAIVAITGTDGKSTTTALIAHLLREADLKALECGNFGLPFSSAVFESTDVFVCECSSYQLEELHYFRPNVALILNIAADHLDRYANMADYVSSKLNLFKNQDKHSDRSIIGMGVKSVCETLQLPVSADTIIEEISSQATLNNFSLEWSEFSLNSETNRKNATLALAAIQDLISISQNRDSKLSAKLTANLGLHEVQRKIIDGLRNFRGLPHRQEYVTQKEGIIFINDSKATTVHSVLSALQSIQDKQVYLLIGGLDKNLDFSVFGDLQKLKGLRLYPFGRAAEKIVSQVIAVNNDNKELMPYSNLEDAFYAALRDAKRNTKYLFDQNQTDSVILLSPACASQDAYKDYKERGEHFRSLSLS